MQIKDKLITKGYNLITGFDNVYGRSESDNIHYSDGKNIEDEIFNTLKDAHENEKEPFQILDKSIINWPNEYHYSWTRQNILKPIDFLKDDVVLELGAGTGINSEYLTKNSNQVVSIEGTLSRARSISARCSKYKNLDIVVANFLEIDLIELFGEKRFSKIVIIGVLEYVPKFASEENKNPISQLLNDCEKLLNEEGELIIAIENKIGLKYLLGWEEDHYSEPHYGTQSLYKRKDITTFTKQNLSERLNIAGFSETDFYYPFPDYKIPGIIVKEDENLLSKKGKKIISSMLSSSKSRNYSGNNEPILDEGRILNNFIENENLGSVSNSFLVIARKNKKEQKQQKPFLYYFSNSRKFLFANEMTFSKIEKEIIVTKKWYGNKTKNELLNLNKEGSITYKFIDGDILHNKLHNCYLLDEKENYIEYFSSWVNLLKTTFNEIDNNYDLLPNNTVISKEGKLTFFDYEEWSIEKKLTISQLIYRYILIYKEHFVWLFDVEDDSRALLELTLEKYDISFEINDIENIDYLHKYVKTNILKQKYFPVRNKIKVNDKKVIIKKIIKRVTPNFIIFLYKKIRN